MFFTDFIHTPGFLRALRDDIDRLGVQRVSTHINAVDDLFAFGVQTCVNCLGLGAHTLFGDDALYPARGLLVLMEPEPLGYIVHDGYNYMFPRDDALILGGCFDPDVWEAVPDDQIALRILAHHRQFFAQG